MALDLARRLDKNPSRCNFMLNSVGGSLSDGLAMYDSIKRIPKSIITGTGVVASAATIVLQAAQLRRATPNTQFQFHLVDFGDVQDNKDFKTHYDNVVFKIFNSKVPFDFYQVALKEKVINAKRALKLGFIDEIWEGASAKSGL
jgi:ATP-dependent protease ClpP protease subunit